MILRIVGLTGTGDYTALWNYVDYPGIVFPTPITAGKHKENYPPEYNKPLSEDDVHVRRMWNETDFQGAPINLQLVRCVSRYC